MNDSSDLEIMRRVQSGELGLVGVLYERYKADLLKYFFRCTADLQKSEDLVQNVFIKVINNKHHFQGTGQFNYWLFRIARNAWIDSAKKKEPLLHSVPIERGHMKSSIQLSSSKVMTIEEQKKKLQKAMEMLSAEKRDAIILSRYEGMDYKTIADISNCSESAIKSRIMRGLTELKELVKN